MRTHLKRMALINDLLRKYCAENDALYHILYKHSRDVADKALRIIHLHPELNADSDFVEEAAMLHDIGIVKTNAPAIECHGTEPYIKHGILGAQIVKDEGLSEYVRVCERHTGTGLTKQEIIGRDLPLPHIDLVPESIEEQIICFADKFFSKTKLGIEKSPQQVRKSLEKFGNQSVIQFNSWCKLFL